MFTRSCLPAALRGKPPGPTARASRRTHCGCDAPSRRPRAYRQSRQRARGNNDCSVCSPRPPHAGTPTERFGELVEALLQRRGPSFGRKLSPAPRGARSGAGLGAIRPNRADRRRNAFSSADDDPTLRGVCSRRGSCAPGASAAPLSGAVQGCSAPHGMCRHRGAVCCLARTT